MSLLSAIYFYIYRYVVVPVLLVLVFVFVAPFQKKVRQGLKLRSQDKLKSPMTSQPIWIHASSGEFEYAKPIITELKSRHPEQKIVVTYFSPSYEKQIKKFKGVDLALALPLDLPGPVEQFIKKLNPKALLVARTDLWPELLRSVAHYKIPSLLFSCTFRKLSGFRLSLLPYYHFLFNQFSNILAVSQDDLNNVTQAKPQTPVAIAGDSRFDQVVLRLQNPQTIKDFIDQNTKPVLVCGSTWPEDEKVLLGVLAEFVRNNQAKVILAPHEPSEAHLLMLENQLTALNLKSSRYSTATHWVENSVLLIDQVGILAELYAHASLAFVGGSFKAKVHSVMEPLAAGCLTFVGPKHKNNREAQDFQNISVGKNLYMVNVINNPTQLNDQLKIALQEQSPEIKTRIQAEVMARTGATKSVISWVEKYL